MTNSVMTSARPRLIILTQWFDPEPAIKGLKFAKRLQDLGFDVEVVTGFPNYPGGKVYNGYKIRLIRREVMDGVAVTRLPLYPSHNSSKAGRIFNYVSFFFSAAFYLIFCAHRADVVYAYHPPPTVAIAAIVARFLRRTPVVLDVQDMWPDTLRTTGMIRNERMLQVMAILCRWVWSRANHISVLSAGFRRLLIERGVSGDKITVIPNWADGETLANGAGTKPDGWADLGKFRVLFAGNMGPAQALDTVIDAAEILGKSSPGVQVCFLGYGVELERLKTRAHNEGLANVHFFPRVPMSEVGAFLAAADCLLVHLKDDPLFAITIPSKTQAYLAAGKPIVMAVEGDAAEMIAASGSGIVVPPENPQQLAQAISRLASLSSDELAKLGDNGKNFYDEKLSFERGAKAFADMLMREVRAREQ